MQSNCRSHVQTLCATHRVSHNRPGTVSLALAENDDDPFIKQRSTYRPTEFLITTGPGPAPSLDGQNVVRPPYFIEQFTYFSGLDLLVM
jgi:hypothetical protein